MCLFLRIRYNAFWHSVLHLMLIIWLSSWNILVGYTNPVCDMSDARDNFNFTGLKKNDGILLLCVGGGRGIDYSKYK